MYITSNAFKKKITENSREIQVQGVIRNGDEKYFLGMNEILSFESSYDMGSDLTVGGVYSAFYKISFKNYDGFYDNIDMEGACATFFIGLKLEENIWEYISTGNLYITKQSDPARTVEIEAYDELILTNVPAGEMGLCLTIKDFIQAAVEAAGLTLYNVSLIPNGDAEITKTPDTENATLRQALGWGCQIVGGFARIKAGSSFQVSVPLAENTMPVLPGAGTSQVEIIRIDDDSTMLYLKGNNLLNLAGLKSADGLIIANDTISNIGDALLYECEWADGNTVANIHSIANITVKCNVTITQGGTVDAAAPFRISIYNVTKGRTLALAGINSVTVGTQYNTGQQLLWSRTTPETTNYSRGDVVQFRIEVPSSSVGAIKAKFSDIMISATDTPYESYYAMNYPEISISNATSLKVSPATQQVTGIRYESEIYGSDVGTVIDLTKNPLVSCLETKENSLNALAVCVSGITYYPFEASWIGDYGLQPGDWIMVRDYKGEKATILMAASNRIAGGLSASASAKTKTSAEKSFKPKTDYETAQLRKNLKELAEQERQNVLAYSQSLEQSAGLMAQCMGAYEFSKTVEDAGWIVGRYISSLTEENTTKSTPVWLSNFNGVAYYPDGISGAPSSAWTNNDTITAKVFSALEVRAEQVTSGLLKSKNSKSWINLDGGTFSLGDGALIWNGNRLSVEGKVTATSGKIGGWNINSDYLSYEGTGQGIGLYPTRIGSTENVVSVWYNSKELFKVDGRGKMTASRADVSGKVTATSGNIGGWDINSTSLFKETDDGNGKISFIPGNIGTTGAVIEITAGLPVFRVDGKGVLSAINANISGNITATSGYVGGWNITEDSLYYTDAGCGAGFWTDNIGTTSPVISVWDQNVNYYFKVSGRGRLWAKEADVEGKITATSGSIGGWNIDSGRLSHTETVGSYTNTIFINPLCVGSSSYAEAMSIYYGNTYTFVLTRLGHVGCTGGLSADGTISFKDVYGNTSSVTTNYVRITSSGQLVTSSSSMRYKRNISENITEFQPEQLLNLKLKQYQYNHGYFADDVDNDAYHCGFIAEDVAEHYPYAAIYDADGNVEMWDSERIIPPMLDLIQKLYKRVETLENMLEVAI